MKINKKIIFVLGAILGFFLLFIVCMILSFRPVTNKSENVTFTIEKGTNKFLIVNNLKKANLIRNKYTALAYLFLVPGQNIQAGVYNINRSENTKEILKQITTGDTKIYKETISVTFVEGLRFDEYAQIIADKFGFSYEDIINVASNKDFLNKLINDYWFITDEILDERIYYPLEGYIHANTYEFYKDSTIEDILIKMVNATRKILDSYEDNIKKSKYSVHELLTIASIIEKEARKDKDRKNISSTLYNRLDIGMSLGCDVTTYYGARMDLDNDIYPDFNELNSYNTRNINFIGLPVSPICSSSVKSIEAAIEPNDTEYLYFVADKNGDCYFYENAADFNANKYSDMAVGG